jgi:hypothetical protein
MELRASFLNLLRGSDSLCENCGRQVRSDLGPYPEVSRCDFYVPLLFIVVTEKFSKVPIRPMKVGQYHQPQLLCSAVHLVVIPFLQEGCVRRDPLAEYVLPR